jgi:hypothetical protein
MNAPTEDMKQRIADVVAESDRLRNLCAQHKITVRPYIGCTGRQFYEAVSVAGDMPVRTVSESRVEAVEDVVWKLENGWGKAP